MQSKANKTATIVRLETIPLPYLFYVQLIDVIIHKGVLKGNIATSHKK